MNYKFANFLRFGKSDLYIYNEKQANTFFWRTTQQQKIDYIEESSGMFDAFVFQWS
jgi:uncharacterized protein